MRKKRKITGGLAEPQECTLCHKPLQRKDGTVRWVYYSLEGKCLECLEKEGGWWKNIVPDDQFERF